MSVRQLARLHILLSDFPAEEVQERRISTDLAEKHTRELKKMKNYLRGKRKKNEFEIEFLRGYSHYMEQALRVLELEQGKQPEVSLQLCHGDVNQHNFLFTDKGLALIGFDKLRMDLCVSDLTNFMRKILEKQGWNGGLGMDMVMAYNGVRQLSPGELRQIYLRLLYPEKYWKLTNHYYNGRKTWVSGRDVEKLRRLLEQESDREEFLSMLFYLVK
jgi:CotS family spore coat protein